MRCKGKRMKRLLASIALGAALIGALSPAVTVAPTDPRAPIVLAQATPDAKAPAPAATPPAAAPAAAAPPAAAPAAAAAAEPAAPTPNKGDTAWMIVATVLVIMMSIPGLALFYGGLVRSKN